MSEKIRRIDDDVFQHLFMGGSEIDYSVRTFALQTVMHVLFERGQLKLSSSARELQVLLRLKIEILKKLGQPAFYLENALRALEILCRPGSPSSIFTMATNCAKIRQHIWIEADQLRRGLQELGLG